MFRVLACAVLAAALAATCGCSGEQEALPGAEAGAPEGRAPEGVVFGSDDSGPSPATIGQAERAGRLRDGTGAAVADTGGLRQVPIMYVVKRGDTISAISKAFYGTDVYHGLLARHNSLSDGNHIRPGDVIVVPALAELPHMLYRVQRSDNLLRIACECYGTEGYDGTLAYADVIASVNELGSVDAIVCGDVLVLPHREEMPELVLASLGGTGRTESVGIGGRWGSSGLGASPGRRGGAFSEPTGSLAGDWERDPDRYRRPICKDAASSDPTMDAPRGPSGSGEEGQ